MSDQLADDDAVHCEICDAPYARLWKGRLQCNSCITVVLLRELVWELQRGIKVVG